MRPDQATLIYDGECGFCREAADLVRRWDREQRIALVPFQDQARVAGFGIPLPALAAAMHLVLPPPDGRVFAGADAAPAILRSLPLPRRSDDHERRLPRAPRARGGEGRGHRDRVGALLDARADGSQSAGADGSLDERRQQRVSQRFYLPPPELPDSGEPGAVVWKGRGARDGLEGRAPAQHAGLEAELPGDAV